MIDPERTSDEYPLPVVSLDVIEVALRDLQEQGHVEYLAGAFEGLTGSNPMAAGAVLAYIEGSVEGAPESEKIQFIAQQAVALLHELLRKQAALDNLDSQINHET